VDCRDETKIVQLFLLLGSIHRDITSHVTQGQIIPCLVSLFQSIDELVDENDRRTAHKMEDNGSVEHNLE
jgi:hypothetical protein